jgi:hypothetical protein
MKRAGIFCKGFIAALSALCLVICVFVSSHAETNTPGVSGDIGNFGAWATEHNRQALIGNLSSDMESFQPRTALAEDYIPPEARVGMAFIKAMGRIGEALQRSFFGFVQILLAVLLAFWIAFESYNLVKSQGSAKELVQELVKKAVLVSVWLWVLSNDPGNIFMTIFGPVLSAGSYASDLLLDSIAGAAGTSLPDTCGAIRAWAGDERIAAMLCMPTRLSGFFYTCIAAGFKWMAAGIGNSLLTFFAGAVFVVIFVMNIWKFALLALGVIADLFLALMFLPFTAIQECFGKGVSYKGIAGDIFKAFAGMFKAASLNDQIMRFVRAAIYFVVLAMVAAIGAALLGGVVRADLASVTPSVESNEDFMSVLIVGCLVSYLVNKASEIAKNLGGAIDDSFGRNVGGDLKRAWSGTKKQISDWRKIYKERMGK